MSDVPLDLETGIADQPDLVASAIQFHGNQLRFLATYVEHINAKFLSHPFANDNRKDHLKNLRVLRRAETYRILALIWKESVFVSEETLSKFAMHKEYKNTTITAHRLATDLAQKPHEVSTLYGRIRTIGLAAAVYGFLDRDAVNKTRVHLQATSTLHFFMTDLAEALLNGLAPASEFPQDLGIGALSTTSGER